MKDLTLDQQRARLQEYERGFFAFYLMKMGIDLGIFTKLNSSGGLTAGELARELHLHEPYVATWCKIAYSMEIMDCDENGKYRMAPHMDTLLGDSGSPYYFGPTVDMRVRYSAQHLKMLPDYLATGDSYCAVDESHEFSKAQKAMSDQGIPTAYIFLLIPSIPGLQERLEAGMRILDVGCGSGLIMVNLARYFPRCKFVGVELDRFAVEDARHLIRENGFEDRVQALFCEAAGMDFSSEFDLVNLTLVLHEIGSERKYASMASCYRALKSGGQIVIFDFVYPGVLQDLRNPVYFAGVLDQFNELVRGSELLTSEAKHQLLLDLGFKDPKSVPLLGGSYEVTYATK